MSAHSSMLPLSAVICTILFSFSLHHLFLLSAFSLSVSSSVPQLTANLASVTLIAIRGNRLPFAAYHDATNGEHRWEHHLQLPLRLMCHLIKSTMRMHSRITGNAMPANGQLTSFICEMVTSCHYSSLTFLLWSQRRTAQICHQKHSSQYFVNYSTPIIAMNISLYHPNHCSRSVVSSKLEIVPLSISSLSLD